MKIIDHTITLGYKRGAVQPAFAVCMASRQTQESCYVHNNRTKQSKPSLTSDFMSYTVITLERRDAGRYQGCRIRSERGFFEQHRRKYSPHNSSKTLPKDSQSTQDGLEMFVETARALECAWNCVQDTLVLR